MGTSQDKSLTWTQDLRLWRLSLVLSRCLLPSLLSSLLPSTSPLHIVWSSSTSRHIRLFSKVRPLIKCFDWNANNKVAGVYGFDVEKTSLTYIPSRST